ncbi:hypothetical protein [Afipia felis]|jgi:hypothetical protein|uniref:hypothetical protein n=1 Tax=Afipia felis TaxID=1035 RepID=UPI001AEBBDAF|nr:hypothetical protein [Afipia felis]
MIYEFILAYPSFVTTPDVHESVRRFKKLAMRIATLPNTVPLTLKFFRHAPKIIPLREV